MGRQNKRQHEAELRLKNSEDMKNLFKSAVTDYVNRTQDEKRSKKREKRRKKRMKNKNHNSIREKRSFLTLSCGKSFWNFIESEFKFLDLISNMCADMCADINKFYEIEVLELLIDLRSSVFLYYAFLYLNQGRGAIALDKELSMLAITLFYNKNVVLIDVILNPIGLLNQRVSEIIWAKIFKDLNYYDHLSKEEAARPIKIYMQSDEKNKIPLMFTKIPKVTRRDSNGTEEVMVQEGKQYTNRTLDVWMETMKNPDNIVFKTKIATKRKVKNFIRITNHNGTSRLYVKYVHTFFQEDGNGRRQFCVELRFEIGEHDPYIRNQYNFSHREIPLRVKRIKKNGEIPLRENE